MGCCSSTTIQAPAGRGPFPAPLPAPMQDNMNELLNRWRHGEVNLLQRRFRLARAQTVKPTMASKFLGSLAPPPSNSGMGTSAAAAASASANRDIDGDDVSTSPASHDGVADADNKKQGDGAVTGAGGARLGAGSGDAEEAMPLGGVGVGGARAGMDREAFLRVFPDVKSLPAEVQRSSFRLFDCVGRGSLDFRNFCRALALCCRGSREERLRFLFDLFSGASQPKHYGTGAARGVCDAIANSGGPAACVSEAELTALKKQLGLSAVDADHMSYQVKTLAAAGAETRPAAKALFLPEYFRWAEAHVSDEALDRALRPFYLLPSPTQEKDKVLTYLMEYSMREGQWMCLVAAPWWSYWCSYAAVTQEDLGKVPERLALGFGKAKEVKHGFPAVAGEPALGALRVGSTPATADVASAGLYSEINASAQGRVGGQSAMNGHGHGQVGLRANEDLGGANKERAGPTVLARRPHEMDNSSLQGGAEWEVAPNMELGRDYVLLPKSLWDVMVDWYGGGPVFCRQVVRVSTPVVDLPGPMALETEANGAALSASRPMVDLYPLALHVNLCDAGGRPGGRERLVLTSHHVHVRDMLTEILNRSHLHGLGRGLAVTAPPCSEQDTVLANGEVGKPSQEDAKEDDDNEGNASGADQTGDVRLWVLEISPTGLTDTPGSHTATASAPAVCRPRFSFVGGGMMAGVDQQTGVSRWKLVKAEEECMTLSELGLVGGEKVMMETKTADGTWPRRTYIEDPTFRQFREGVRVDAMDYQGRWFRGKVVEVAHKSGSRIVDSEGPVGRKKSSRRSRSQPSLEEGSRSSTILEDPQLERSESEPSTAVSKKAVLKQSSSQHLESRRGPGNSGEGGVGSVREGGGSRRRMRVRVHFDRFAPQWDEWYDSKSLKLAPEISYTAPLVSAQQALKPREEGAADPEVDEELSPNAPSAKGATASNASSSSSKSGPNAFPPPVGRFPGDAGTGNNWNSRSHGNSGYAPSRPNASGPSGTTDGTSNYGGGALNRRSNTAGKPHVPGACGLVNVGNTCYLNSAVQCLSHTPLVRAYLLSDMWAAEVNKYNPLGTQGKLVEDFASLLKSLWSQEYLCIFPSKFKRVLIKYKPQFAGNEQQDSQEFLAEMLDALHEDVNRVIEKPYVPAPEENEAESGKSNQDLADEAWNRHVQRNRSVIVDLFQGQLKMECRCPVCNKKSVTFDPFMYLSVPIPIRNEKMVAVVLLPRIRTRDIVGSEGDRAGGAVAGIGEVAEFSNPRQLVPVQYGMMLPRMGELSDLKRALSGLCGMPPSSLVVSVLFQNQVRVLGDQDPLTNVREDDFILAFAMGLDPRREKRAQPQSAGSPVALGPAAATVPPPPPAAAAAAAAVGEDEGASASPDKHAERESAQGSTVANGTAQSHSLSVAAAEVIVELEAETAGVRAAGEDSAVKAPGSGSNEGLAESVAETATVDTLSSSASDEEEDTDLDEDRPPHPNADHRSPDERCMGSLPTRLRELEVGWRLDALDGQGGWFAATVVEVDPQAKRLRRGGDKASKGLSSSPSGDGHKRKTEHLVKVHFDGFTSKWDECYGEQEWRDNKLARLYTKSRPQERTLDIPVVHRKTIRVAAPGAHGQSGATVQGSSRDGAHGGRSEGDGDGRDPKEPHAGFVTAKDLFGLPFLIRCPPKRSARYLWRLVVQQASRFVLGSSSGSRSFKSRDRMAKSAAGANKRPHVTAAWVARAAVGLENGITDEQLAELLPFTIKFVLRQNPLTDVGGVELVPDRWRAASSLFCPKLILALEWKDASRDYLDVLHATFDHPSYLELENNAQSVLSGLTLEQCLEAYTREETLEEEDSWYCSSCRAHRRGIMKIDLWKMPDVLVMHMKRFQCSARWREKIRTLVVFPHSGLDMSRFVSRNSAHRNQAGGGQAGMVYDLYGVVNHMGGMTGGHYTASCRSSPCSKDGVEEVAGWGLEHPWLYFDDEFVEEIAPDKIVSEGAYVLFYRRRRLTPSNVINMTI